MESWAEVMRKEITRILDRPYVHTTVAYESDDPRHVYGYLVAEPSEAPPLVYWAYVKQAYRRQSLAYALFRAADIDPQARWDYVCSTPIVSRLRLPNARWRPLLGRYSREHREHAR